MAGRSWNAILFQSLRLITALEDSGLGFQRNPRFRGLAFRA